MRAFGAVFATLCTFGAGGFLVFSDFIRHVITAAIVCISACEATLCQLLSAKTRCKEATHNMEFMSNFEILTHRVGTCRVFEEWGR